MGRIGVYLMLVALPLTLSVGSAIGFVDAASQAGAWGWAAGIAGAALGAGGFVALRLLGGTRRVPTWSIGVGSAMGAAALGLGDIPRAGGFAFLGVFFALAAITIAVRLNRGVRAPLL